MEQRVPKVTVIIPVYNVELYLEECLNSVVNQSLKEIEIICVNDGSTDHSLELLKNYALKDSRIQIISQENKGLSASRNKGMECAAGEYLYFLDSDDYIEQNAMESLYEQAKSESAEIIYFNAKAIFESEELERKYQTYMGYYQRNSNYIGVKTGVEMAEEMYEHRDYKVACPLQFFSASFLKSKNITFREGILNEDNLFSLEAFLYAKRVMYMDKVFYNRRIRQGSISTLPMSFDNYKGYYECMLGVQDLMARFKKELTKRLEKRLLWLVGYLKKKADEVYSGLEEKEQERAEEYKRIVTQERAVIEQKNREQEDIGFSIIAPTNKNEAISNIIENYKRQEWKRKELIIVLNQNSISIEKVREMVKGEKDISVYQLEEHNSLGKCLNLGTEKANYNYIAKFDDDDYYGCQYLTEAAQLLQTRDCTVVGKSDYYVYFKECEILCKWKFNKRDSFVKMVAGGTIICKRDIAMQIGFGDYEVGTDRKFLQKVNDAGYKVYSGSNHNYLYLRYLDTDKHTWKIQPEYYTQCEKTMVWRNIKYWEVLSIINGKGN